MRVDFAMFKQRAEAKHGCRYTYDEASWLGVNLPVRAHCATHGWWAPLVTNHLRGSLCPGCSLAGRSGPKPGAWDDFLKRAKEAHGGAFTYSDIGEFKGLSARGGSSTVEATCKHHGAWRCHVRNHVYRKAGCPACGHESRVAGIRMTPAEARAKAEAIHGVGRYLYTRLVSANADQHQDIECPAHGVFSQTLRTHLDGHGCRRCADARRSKVLRLPEGEWEERSRALHAGKYAYPAPLTAKMQRAQIVCPEHGMFEQTLDTHIRKGSGCPVCAQTVRESKGEREVADFLKSLGCTTEKMAGSSNRLELDIVASFPGGKLAVEFHGDYWHCALRSDRARMLPLRKLELATAQGLPLVQIFEHQWSDERTQRTLKALLTRRVLGAGLAQHARKCSVVEVDGAAAAAFHNAYHVQGEGRGTLHLGLVLAEVVLACATFRREMVPRVGRAAWTLVRFSSSCQVVGGMSRLMKHAMRRLGAEELFTYSDPMLFTGGAYAACGFKDMGRSAPDYHYCIRGLPLRKKRLQLAVLPVLFERMGCPERYDPAMSERDAAEALHARKLYNAGLHLWHLS